MIINPDPLNYSELLTVEGVTVVGVLIIVCVYLGWKLHKAEVLLKEAESNRIKDLKEYNVEFLKVSDKMHDFMRQMKDIFKKNV